MEDQSKKEDLSGGDRTARAELPSFLFDGYYVWNEGLSEEAKKRTSPENVADVLDAVVCLYRAALSLAIEGKQK